jgi:F-type H+-transporting ATPase subunit delta
MLGSSRASLESLHESLTAIYDDPTWTPFLRDAGLGVLSVVDVAAGERSLRELWSDGATSSTIKNGVLTQLFGSRIPELSMKVVQQAIDCRWSSANDLVDALEQAGEMLLLMAAERDGSLDRVEEELFRFGRVVQGSDDLQMALTDPSTPPSVKQGIVTELLDGKADRTTEDLVRYLAGHLRGRRMTQALEALSSLAAVRRDRVVAQVTAAVPLTDAQTDRLAAVLGRIQGRRVLINVIVDPSVVGGIEVRVGDDVIDGTLANRIEQARRRLTS